MPRPETPAEWRDLLLKRLIAQREHIDPRLAWYRVQQPTPVVESKYASEYRHLIDISRGAFAMLVVDILAERTHWHSATTGDDDLDAALRMVVGDDNAAAVDQWLVHTEAYAAGLSYALLDLETGELCAETAEQVVTIQDPNSSAGRKVAPLAAAKVWKDTIGDQWMCQVWLPESVWRWRAESSERLTPQRLPQLKWFPDGDAPNPYGEVPVERFVVRPQGGDRCPVGEIEPVIPILRKIDNYTLDLLKASKLASFRQKFAIGVPLDDAEQAVAYDLAQAVSNTAPQRPRVEAPFAVGTDKMLHTEATRQEAQFGTFEASEIRQWMEPLSGAVGELVAVTRVPAHYLMNQSLVNPPSADSMDAAEGPLVKKVEARRPLLGESWARLLRLRLARDTAGAEFSDLRLHWTDAKLRNEARDADRAVKMANLVPLRFIYTDILGLSEARADELIEERAEQEATVLAEMIARQPMTATAVGGAQPQVTSDAGPVA